MGGHKQRAKSPIVEQMDQPPGPVSETPLDRMAAQRLGPWFLALTRAVPLGVLALGTDSAILDANRPARELLGLGETSDRGARLERLGRLLAPRFDRLAPGEIDEAEVAVDPEHGGRVLRLRLSALDGEHGGRLVLVEDSARRTALESSLVLASRMQSATILRQRVHDLKAPLNSLALNLELLKRSIVERRDSAPEACDEELGLTEVLRKEIARLGRSLDVFMRQALEPERAERGLRRIDLRRTVREVVRLVRPSANACSVRLRAELPLDAVEVQIDRDLVKQALLNLVLNALEAQPEGGEIRLRLASGQDDVRLAVEDDGPGIPAELRERVLEMNFTTKADGNGIGLTVARSVVESQGGRLELGCSPSGGATVVLYFPAIGGHPPPPLTARSAPDPPPSDCP